MELRSNFVHIFIKLVFFGGRYPQKIIDLLFLAQNIRELQGNLCLSTTGIVVETQRGILHLLLGLIQMPHQAIY